MSAHNTPVAWGLFAKVEGGDFHLQHPVRFTEADAKADCLMYERGTPIEIRPLYDRAVAGWQPIEAAPKDGTLMIARGNNYGDANLGQHHCIVSWYRGCWMEESDQSANSDLTFLTCWMPLTPQPTPKAKP